MNAQAIRKALLDHPLTSERFCGVYARDEIRDKGKGFYVVNLDESTKPGSHWICIELNGDSKPHIYFDSYGLAPTHPDIIRFMKAGKIVHNRKKLQHHLATTCGHWCIYFVWRRCQGWNIGDIVRAFKVETPLENDYVMTIVLKKEFKNLNDTVIDRAFLKEQLFLLKKK